jgi:integrase
MTAKPARTRTRITLATVRSALKERPAVVVDTEIPGFALHVSPKRAFWTFSYSPRGSNPATGRRWRWTRLELGDVGVTTLPEARTRALEAKALVRTGRDPQREKTAARTALLATRGTRVETTAEALAAYEAALGRRRNARESTRRQALAYARKAIRLMGADEKAPAAIAAHEIRAMLDRLEASDAERRHVFGGLKRFLSWCVKEGVVETSPCDDLRRDERPKPARARDNAPDLATLRKVWRALEDEPAPVRDLMRFLLLTPLRLNEAAGLKWSEVDLSRGWIRVDGARMKNGEPHELPLSDRALAILERRREEATSRSAGPAALAFPSPEAGTQLNSWTRLTTRVRRAIGHDALPKDRQFRWHDIRRSFVTALAEEFDEAVLDAMLAHRRKGVAGVYQKQKYLNRRPAVMARWAALIAEESATANVIPLRAGVGA